LHQNCKLQAKSEQIRKKAEVFIGLVNKLLCWQSQTKTAIAASEEPAKAAESAASVSNPFKGARATLNI
jgi:hypothetical protein